ncbi:hypothetical protein GOP47_0013965 [Adiantum capillus-veneris]|uniref:DNA-directed DNA polymerase n=1 Tax=Adiantum capillus-veneris TaxID=13818 RepID=A0A9D4UQ06_ADICA|nr:hypothetical protein GOP47_0013965 [Adiantum capillus-veneris]
MDGDRVSRVDEFFRAKKRRSSSSNDLPSSRLDKVLQSPSKKNTLDNYLVATENDRSYSEVSEALDAYASRQREDLEKKDRKLCKQVLNKDQEQPASFLLRRCSLSSIISSGNEDLQVAIKKDEGDKSKNDGAVAAEMGKHNNELAQFANDFLSICCSDIVSSVTSPSKLSTHAQITVKKGDNENSIDKSKDKVMNTGIAGNEQLDNAPTLKQSVGTSSSNYKVDVLDVPDDLRDGPFSQNVAVCSETAVSSSIKPHAVLIKSTASDLTFESPAVSNRRGRASLSGVKRKNVSTPRTKSASRLKRPAGWSAGTSLFSPGDEFWDEAISLVDGLVSNKVDGASNSSVTVVDGRQSNFSPNVGTCHAMPSYKLPDAAKGNVLQREKGMIVNCSDKKVHEETVLNPECRDTPLPHASDPLVVNNTYGRVSYNLQDGSEVSPLPVRRFDFSNSPDKVDDVKNLLTDKNPSGLPVENVNGVALTSSMPMKAELSPKDSGGSVAEELAGKLEKTATKGHGEKSKMQDKVETGSIIYQFVGTMEKSKPTIEGAAPAVSLPISVTPESKSNLSDWLPGPISSVYAKKGLMKLYPWQVDCLQLNGVLEGKNLIYCASTSAGKSLVAEILMLRKVISTGKKALLVLPYVSICSEKAEHLDLLLEPFGKKVGSFFGTRGGASLPKDSSIAVCTIEKANSLINKLLEEGRLPELAVVVIDELHMVGDKDRGYLLEVMLTKLRYAAGEGKDSTDKTPEDGVKESELQIIGMSATMPNAAAVAKWLQAALYETNFRPVPLDEYIKVANSIYNKNMEVVRMIRKSADLAGKDPDHVVELCHEWFKTGILCCCFVQAVKHELQKCPAGLDPVLAETIPKGVAYHHAGLTVEEREMVEACYRSGIVRVLTATSTLAAGVNLPARRVIFRQPRIGRDFLDGTRYRQMAGRAGRAGIDTRGESILICKPEELKRMSSLLIEECQPLLSCLADDKNGMTRAISEVVAGGIVQSAVDVERYVKCTLLNSTQSFQEVVKSAQDSLRWLCHHKLLEWDQNTKLYNCTPLGKAAFGSSLSPEESLIVFEDLAKAREGFVLASDLHLLYQVTPIYVELEPDWSLYYKKFVELSQMDQAVGNRVGVMEPFLMRMAHGAPIVEARSQSTGKSPRRKRAFLSPVMRKGGRTSPTSPLVEHTFRVCKRFYVSLMLAKLIQEVPLMEVCESFKVARGMVQALQEISGRFASMVSAFCERLGWHDLEGLISKFQSRVCFGVRAEIVELAEIPYVKASRARALYKAGLRTPQAVAEATLPELAKALFDSSSWASQDGSKNIGRHRIQMGMARKIQNGARKLVLERAEAARVAAFSALRALGVDVPAALSKPLADNNGLVQEQIEGPKICTTHEEQNDLPEVHGGAENLQPHLNEEACMLSLHTDDHGCMDLISKPHGELINQNLGSRNDSLNHGPVDVDSLLGGFDEFYSLWKKQEEFFFDLHFYLTGKETGYPVYDVKGLAVCWVGSPIYYVSLGETSTTEQVKDGEIVICARGKERWRRLTASLRADAVQKVTWNWKDQVLAFHHPSLSVGQTDQIAAENLQLVTANQKFVDLPEASMVGSPVDLQIAAWILWPDEESAQSFSLEQEIKRRLPGNLAAKASREGRWINQMGRVAHNGCCRRVAQIRALHSVIWKLVVAEGLNQPLLQQEMPLVPLLAELEAFGITVDMEECKRARQQLESKIKELEGRAHDLAGVLFSLSVPAEVASVLYTHLKLPIPAGCNRKKQHPSTDKQALDALKGQHPIIEVIKEHRTLAKVLHSTLGSILFKARPMITREGHSGASKSIIYRVKGRWLQTSTATGRLSMEEPNLQCVEHPLKFTIMQQSEHTSKDQSAVECTINARDFFLPSQEGWILLSADYSQIEVRLMAHFSGDPALIELLSRPTGDLFKLITARWTEVTEANVTERQRDLTKRLVYGILYGMGISALADQLECSVSEAAEKYKRFKTAFPGVAKWLKEAVNRCREQGYISTLAGRRRYLDKIKYGTLSERSKAERQAVNSICQGSAADLIKIAMNKLFPVGSLGRASPGCVQNEKTMCSSPLQGKFRLLLQIHDELVLETEKSALPKVAAFLCSCMEGAASLKGVRLVCKIMVLFLLILMNHDVVYLH